MESCPSAGQGKALPQLSGTVLWMEIPRLLVFLNAVSQRRGEGWLPVDRLLKDQGICSRGDALVREVSCPSPGVPHPSKLDSAAQSGRITAS